jgi:hypothetical protein
MAKSDPAKAIKILDPDSHALEVDKSSTLSMSGAYDVTLPATGNYTLRITGMSGVAQGPYQLEMVAEADVQDFNGFNSTP